MTSILSDHAVRLVTIAAYWLGILLGPILPWAGLILMDVFVRHVPLDRALHDFHMHLFAPGYNFFIIGLLNAVPFLAFALLTLGHMGTSSLEDVVQTRRRLAGITGAGITVTGASLWTHLSILLHPDAQGGIAYLFLPVILLALLPVGYAAGRLIGLLLVPARVP